MFPEDCRACGITLTEGARIPVCSTCLQSPEVLTAPYQCARCGTPFHSRFPLGDTGICHVCRSGLQGFEAVYSFGAYEGTLRRLVHLFKYGGIPVLRKPLGKLLRQALPLEERFDAIVPVPLHWYRRWRRGYNQAELLAKEVAASRRIPVVQALRRVRRTPSQSGLTRAQRRANVTAAFDVRANVAGKRVLLIDDVFTTGATARACAAALKRAGAARVAVLTVARADRRYAVDVVENRTSEKGAS